MTSAPLSQERIGLPRLYPWQRIILRLVTKTPGLTTREIGDRYYPSDRGSARVQVALHELNLLARAGLVQRARDRWSPSLLADITLRQGPSR